MCLRTRVAWLAMPSIILRLVLAEPEVVFEEVAVGVDVGHDEFLVGDGVGALEVGVAGVVVDDHFVDASEAVVVLLGHAFVFHAEAPVGVAHGEAAEGGDLVDLVVVEHFEDDVEEVEAVGFGGGADLLVGGGEFGREVGGWTGELGHARVLSSEFWVLSSGF